MAERWNGWIPALGIALVAIGTALSAAEWGDLTRFDGIVVSGIPEFRELDEFDAAKRACNDISQKHYAIERSVVSQLSTHVSHAGFGGGRAQGGPYRNEEFVIAAIGYMRAGSAIPALLEQIDRKSEIAHWSSLHHGPRFINDLPAFDALVKIGYPACQAAALRIPRETDDFRRQLQLDVIRRGVPIPIGKALLKMALEKTTAADGPDRIQAAVDALDDAPLVLPKQN